MSKEERTVIIFNIPQNFGSSDLRRAFTTYAEAGKFETCKLNRLNQSIPLLNGR